MEVSKPVSIAIIVIVVVLVAAIGYTMFLKPKGGSTSADIKKMYEQRGYANPQPGGSGMGAQMGGSRMPGGSAQGGAPAAGAGK